MFGPLFIAALAKVLTGLLVFLVILALLMLGHVCRIAVEGVAEKLFLFGLDALSWSSRFVSRNARWLIPALAIVGGLVMVLCSAP